MKMKRWMLAAVAAAAVAACAMPAWAEHTDDPTGVSDETGYGKKEGFFKELNLTDQQKEALKARREQKAGTMKTIRENLKAKRQELKAELAKPTVDRAAITALASDIKGLTGRMIDLRIDGVLGMKEILTPEQFQKMQAKMDGKRAKWGEHKQGGRKKD